MENKVQAVKKQITGVNRIARGIVKASLAPLTGFGLKDIIEGARDIGREKSPEAKAKDEFEKRLENLECMFAAIAAKEYEENGLPVKEDIKKE